MRKRSALLLAALIFILASCKTTSPAVEEQVNVLALLEQDSSIYVRIPVSSHVDLTSAVLSSAFDGVSKKMRALLPKGSANFTLESEQ